MAISIKRDPRFVLPVWRDFKRTLEIGELNSPSKVTKRTIPSFNLDSLTEDWNENNSLFNATDLLSGLFVSNSSETKLMNELVEFISGNKNATIFQKYFAKSILKKSENKDILDQTRKIEPLLYFLHDNDIHEKIRLYKSKIIEFPNNSILYIDLAWYYFLIGQIKQAHIYIERALILNSNNRFILRSASKFFEQIEDIEKARDILRRSPLNKIDPWVMASEISLSDKTEKRSSNIKRGTLLINSNNFSHFDLSELSSALGTQELRSGNRIKSKKLFTNSLISPNSNTIAQAEWISNEFNLFNFNPDTYEVINNFEAKVYDAFYKEDWTKSYENSLLWYYDVPYSEDAIIVGSYIAMTFLENLNGAEELLELGHKINPHSGAIINNLAFCKVKVNKLDEAKQIINKLEKINIHNLKNNEIICLIATQGLISIKSGNLESGIQLYDLAIQRAKKSNNNYLETLAKINLALELDQSTEMKDVLVKEISSINIKPNEKDLLFLKNKLMTSLKA